MSRQQRARDIVTAIGNERQEWTEDSKLHGVLVYRVR